MRVHAAAITRAELEWPVDRLPAIPSYELSGVVVGSGDEVYALTPFDRDGVAAEYAVVPADVLAPKPLRLSHVEAAALPMGGLTAWQALFVHGRLARGERVLVTGASGGVGHIAVQLARHAGAAVVESGPVDLVFDTRGGEVPAGERVVTIAEEMPGAIYFIVETRPRATAAVENARGRRRLRRGRFFTPFFRSRRPGRRSSESRAAGSVARSCSRLALTSRRVRSAAPSQHCYCVVVPQTVAGAPLRARPPSRGRSRRSPPSRSARA